MKLFALLLVVLLAGCATSYKVITQYGYPQVLHRPDFKSCPRLWYGITSEYTEEAYGHPCDIVIRYYKNDKVYNR